MTKQISHKKTNDRRLAPDKNCHVTINRDQVNSVGDYILKADHQQEGYVRWYGGLWTHGWRRGLNIHWNWPGSCNSRVWKYRLAGSPLTLLSPVGRLAFLREAEQTVPPLEMETERVQVSKHHRSKTRTVESSRKAFYCRKSISRQVGIFNPCPNRTGRWKILFVNLFLQEVFSSEGISYKKEKTRLLKKLPRLSDKEQQKSRFRAQWWAPCFWRKGPLPCNRDCGSDTTHTVRTVTDPQEEGGGANRRLVKKQPGLSHENHCALTPALTRCFSEPDCERHRAEEECLNTRR